MDDLMKSMRISASGMRAQGTRLRIIAQNIANAESLPTAPGKDPYQRQTVSFKTVLDRTNGVEEVAVDRIRPDAAPFSKEYKPYHPAADADGYVLAPNVKPMIEMADMRESQRSYEANLGVVRASKAMVQQMIELLR
jgi:flagellar basal-body rod protein FlgC